MKFRFLIAAALVAAPFAIAPLAAQGTVAVPSGPMIGTWGVDLQGGDPAVKPGDDFERHTSGKWIEATPIPADRASIGAFVDLHERTQEMLRTLITTAPASSKYGAMYQSFMDEAQVEAVGLAPLKADLAKVDALATKRDFARFMGTTNGGFGHSVVSWFTYADTANPAMTSLYVNQSGLGLPNREYYFDKQFQTQRDAYVAYIGRTLKMLGEPNSAAAAKAIMAFETEIAKVSWKPEDTRDITRLNNPMSTAELMAYAPGLEWSALFAGAEIPPQQRLIAATNTALRDIAAVYDRTPLATLKLWQKFHVANDAAPYLNKAMVDNRFQFIRTLTGVKELRARWRRAVTQVDSALGELVGQDYVAQHFPASSKAKMEALVANLKLAMGDRIQGNDWMSPATKAAAAEKLARMDVMVGYPDEFRNYDALEIRPGDLYGNVQRASVFNAAYAMSDLGKPVDRKKWVMNPQMVNAYNGGLENKIVFPAGILQAPFFDPAADDAANYGAIGAVIGHEITHGFDDEGRKIDATGAVRDWWANGDGERFEARAKVFGDQYAKFEAAPGAFINPKLTMGENIADLAGLLVAIDAYRKSLGGKPAPVIDGLTGEQRLFLAFAQVWRSKMREDALRNQVASDPHSPERFRLLGPIRNIDAWYEAFGVKPGDAMYIPPEQRARIW